MTATAQKAYKGMGMEGSMARWYEKTTRRSMEDFRRLASRLESLAPAGGDFLEVAPGPGFLSVEMARRRQFRVTGLDISRTFVQIARKNAAEAGVIADFHQGSASEMPFPADRFDLLVCRAAFKNFSRPEQALREMHRVLRPGGTGIIIDLRHGVPMAEIERHVDGMGLNLWNRWFTLLSFRCLLLRRAYTPEVMEAMLARIPFRKAEVRTADIGMEIWFEK